MDEFKKLKRSSENKMVAGVASGLAEYFNVDPTLIRVIFVILVLTGGSGVILYLILWLILPSSGNPHEVGQKDVISENVDEMRERAEEVVSKFASNEPLNNSNPHEVRKFFGFFILALGIIFLLSNFGFFRWDLFWPFLLILVGFYLLARK